MMTRRFASVGLVIGLGMICLLVVWVVCPAPQARTGGLSVTFGGLTKAASGAMIAEYNVSNTSSRRVVFAIGEVQVRQTNGWPNWVRDAWAGGSNWTVAAGSKVGFSVSAPSSGTVTWRVPLICKADPPLIDEMRWRIAVIANCAANWRPGSPMPVVHGDGRPTSVIFGPQMVGASNSRRGVMDYGP